MKILIVTSDFIPSWGGMGAYVTELIDSVPNDVEIYVLCPYRSNLISESEYLIRSNYKNIHINYISRAKDNFLYNLKFQVKSSYLIKKYARLYNVDVILTQSSMPDLFVKPSHLKIPIVTTVHSTIKGQVDAIRLQRPKEREFSESMVMKTRFITLPLENIYYSKNQNFIAVSNWSKEELIKTKKIQRDKIRTIPNGINPEIYKPYLKKECSAIFPSSDPNKLRILFLSRLLSSKGLGNLIKVIPTVLKRVDAEFIIAGPGTYPGLEKMTKMVEILGYIPREKTPTLYASSDIFVLPSYYENFPMTILEAMSSGLAVVSTRVGGIPEIIDNEKDGLMIQPSDIDGLSNKLIWLVENNKERIDMGRKARLKIQNKFNSKLTSERTLEFLKEVTGK
jgi:glycosyltransferase involved in cell wall biosynthesis